MRTPAVTLFLLALASHACAQAPRPGETVWGTNQYVEYMVGNGPVILCSPHGGYLLPADIPDRTYGVTMMDRKTQEVTRALSDEIAERTGHRPHVIISHLNRIKLDPNREIVEAAQGDPQAELAWAEFHGFIDTAVTAVVNDHGQGLLLDMHGQSHPEGWIEFGYLLSPADLALPDPQLQDPVYIDSSSMRALGSQPGISFPEIIRGVTSFGGYMTLFGYDCVPSPVHPDPAGGNYFAGGYDLIVHSSITGHTVDGIQIELPFDIRETGPAREIFCARLTTALIGFFSIHHGIVLTVGPRITVAATDAVATETGSTATFSVTRTGNTSAAAVVSYVVLGSATPGADHVALPGSVTIPAGSTTATVTLIPLDDLVVEGTETVTVALTGGIEIGAQSEATIRLLDDEGEPDHIMWLDLDETSGPTAHDVTGSGHDGVLMPDAATGPQRVTGNAGGALSFDEVDDHVRVNDFAYAPSGGFSLAFWFKAPAMTGTAFQYVFSHGVGGARSGLNIHFNETTGRLRSLLVYDNDIVWSDINLDIDEDLRDDQWHLYVLTTAPGQLTHIYIDGAVAATAFVHGDTFDPATALYAGARSDLDADRYYGGLLDDVQVWSRALDATEVGALHDGPDPAAAVYPGSGEDLLLETGVDGDPVAGPLLDVKDVPAGSTLNVRLSSPGGTFTGSLAILGLQPFTPGNPPSWPAFTELWLAPNAYPLVEATLPATGLEPSYVVPLTLSGLTFMMQGVAIAPTAANGVFAATDGHELRAQ